MRPSDRICVLTGRMEFRRSQPGHACASRLHGHMSAGRAAELVDEGQAEWLETEVECRTKSGCVRVRTRRESAIRFTHSRRLCPTPSYDPQTHVSVTVVQLVS